MTDRPSSNPTHVRSALFVDFDNIYLGLQNEDPRAAEQFATHPGRWLRWLQEQLPNEARPQRKILSRRCYLNPSQFSRFRPYFIRSAFEVVDCPPLTRGGKTSADIQMVMDIMDALSHVTRFEEFIILSGDADFTPVLLRLSRHDRRSVVLAAGPASAAYKAACDLLIDQDTFLEEAIGISEGSPVRPGTDSELLQRIAAKVHEKAEGLGELVATDLPGIFREFAEFTPDSNWLGFYSLRGMTSAVVHARGDLEMLEGDPWRVRTRSGGAEPTGGGAAADSGYETGSSAGAAAGHAGNGGPGALATGRLADAEGSEGTVGMTAQGTASPQLLRSIADKVHARTSAAGELLATDLPGVYREFSQFTPTSNWLGFFSLRGLSDAVLRSRGDLEMVDGDPWRVRLRPRDPRDPAPHDELSTAPTDGAGSGGQSASAGEPDTLATGATAASNAAGATTAAGPGAAGGAESAASAGDDSTDGAREAAAGADPRATASPGTPGAEGRAAAAGSPAVRDTARPPAAGRGATAGRGAAARAGAATAGALGAGDGSAASPRFEGIAEASASQAGAGSGASGGIDGNGASGSSGGSGGSGGEGAAVTDAAAAGLAAAEAERQREIDRIVEFVRRLVASSDSPVPMARGAHAVIARFGEGLIASRWHGAGTFRDLLAGRGELGFAVSAARPGYLYDPDLHQTPLDTQPEEFEVGDPELNSLAHRIHRITDTPSLSVDEYALVFREIAEEVNEEGYFLTRTSKAVRDRCIAKGTPIARTSVNFILRGIASAGHRFDSEGNSTNSLDLANAFLKNVLGLCESAGMPLSDEERRQLTAWIVGGLTLASATAS